MLVPFETQLWEVRFKWVSLWETKEDIFEEVTC